MHSTSRILTACALAAIGCAVASGPREGRTAFVGRSSVYRLSIDSTNLAELDRLPEYPRLTELVISDVRMPRVPSGISALSALRSLTVRSVTELDATGLLSALRTCPDLEVVHIADVDLSGLSATARWPRSLRELSLSRTGVRNLLSRISDQSALEVLALRGESSVSIGPGIARLQTLRTLVVKEMEIEEIPGALRSLRLEELVVEKCPRIDASATLAMIAGLETLSHVRVAASGVEEIPVELLDHPGLLTIGLDGNEIRDLPRPSGTGPRWQGLNLSGNRMRSLPSWIASLPTLNWLDLTDNSITRLPAELFDRRRRLQFLRVGGNPLSTEDSMRLERERPARAIDMSPG